MVYVNWWECLTLFLSAILWYPYFAPVVLFSAYFSWVQHLNKHSTYIYPSICAKKKCGLQGYPAPKFVSGSSWWTTWTMILRQMVLSMPENKILKQSWCELLENIVMVKLICLSFFKFEKKFLVAQYKVHHLKIYYS